MNNFNAVIPGQAGNGRYDPATELAKAQEKRETAKALRSQATDDNFPVLIGIVKYLDSELAHYGTIEHLNQLRKEQPDIDMNAVVLYNSRVVVKIKAIRDMVVGEIKQYASSSQQAILAKYLKED